MPSPTQLSLSAPPHRNQQLFSDHYLDVTLPRNDDWQLLAADAEVRTAKQRIAALLSGFKPSTNEAQTEQDLVRPVLELLGHTYEVQPALTTPDGTKRPDYVLYGDAAARDANKNRTLNEGLLIHAFAVGDAKYWDRPLDIAVRTASASSDPFSNKNPSYQIAFYMQHSGVAWGILTNGRLWRLYHKDTAHKLDRFYEVDLQAAATASDPTAFLYFFAFFHRQAFEPAPRYGSSLGLSALLRASQDYARGVSDTLKTQVYEALRHVAQGFLDHPQNGLQPDPATLKAIYDNALIVLYRLLFILYAEARELLPVRENAAYRDEYSLRAIKDEVKRNLDGQRALLPSTKRIWQKLDELFDIINLGSPPLKVSTFNGGLFDPDKHPFLKSHAVGDAQLQQAIDKLARANGEFIDYRDLAERHLGTIYEGLLEFQLRPPAPKGGTEGEAEGSVPSDSPLGAGGIDLVNDKGERKATGSYYTPDTIVKYIVDQAVGPALRQATATARTDADKVRAILTLNVLDPAMGSGHFLVEVVEYIARYLVDLGVAPPSASGSPLGVGGGAGGGDGDLAYWKRRVAQSCVYGVDLNPLAVELAKLSLWLVTVAKDRPLSFLDHHLRAGNSLVGARLADVRAFAVAPKQRRKKANLSAAPQAPLFSEEQLRQDMFSAVGSMFLIEDNPALTVGDVKLQEQTYLALRAALTQRYKVLADLMTAQRFGLEIDPALLPALTARATGKSSMGMKQIDEVLAQAERLAADTRCLHWEIEFPEVFFDRNGESLGDAAGFDAVVGNPPYVRQEQLAPFKPYFQGAYPDVYDGTADLFVYFFGRGVGLLQRGGRLSYIASNSWLRANYATKLRAFMRTQVTVETLVDLGDNRVFADAPDVYPAIPVVRRDAPGSEHTAQVAVFNRGEGLASFQQRLADKLAQVAIHDQDDAGWQLGDIAKRLLLKKLIAHGIALSQLLSSQTFSGVKTGLNEAFIVDHEAHRSLTEKNPLNEALLRIYTKGEDLRSWYVEDEQRWLIFIPFGWTNQTFANPENEYQAWQLFGERHPEIAHHLKAFESEARNRQDQGQYWWELRPCDYYRAFERQKILWAEISKAPRFSMDVNSLFVSNKGHLVPTEDWSILGVLQTRPSWFLISHFCSPLGERAGMLRYQLLDQYMGQIPIPDMTDAQRRVVADLALHITEQAKARYALHRAVRARIVADLGNATGKPNQKLTAWWDLPSLAAFRAELAKSFKADVPLRERADWEAWLAERRAEHMRFTAEIVRLEADLNAQVYALFDLTPSEIKLIEDSTKYRYGEV